MIERLKFEIKHVKTEIKKQISEGVKYPEGQEPPAYSYDRGEKVDTVSIKVDCFKAELDHKGFKGDLYKLKNFNQANLMALVALQKKYNAAIAVLRFMVRATEFAFYKYGGGEEQSYIFPSWMKNQGYQ